MTNSRDIPVIGLLPLRDIIEDAIQESLTDLERWVWNSLVVELMSLRQLERQISIPKTTLARIRDRAQRKLRDALQDHPIIQEYLEQ